MDPNIFYGPFVTFCDTPKRAAPTPAARAERTATMSRYDANEARIKELKAKIYDGQQAIAAQRARHEAQLQAREHAEAAKRARLDSLLALTPDGQAIIRERQSKG
jgi:hypothetical protein